MSILDRRTFLLGGTVALALPLWGCGGGSGIDLPPVVTNSGPMSATVSGVQYQTLPESHKLVVTTKGVSTSYGGVGLAAGQLNFPNGVVVLNGLAYVVETGNHRVQIFDATGASRGTFGEDVLLYPGGIAAGKGEIFVSDSRHGRIVSFTPEGKMTSVIGQGTLSAPRGLAYVDGTLLVADPGLRRVLRLSLQGAVLADIGGWVLPWDVATDGTYIFVADVSANVVAVFSFDGVKLDEARLDGAPRYISYRDGTLFVV